MHSLHVEPPLPYALLLSEVAGAVNETLRHDHARQRFARNLEKAVNHRVRHTKMNQNQGAELRIAMSFLTNELVPPKRNAARQKST